MCLRNRMTNRITIDTPRLKAVEIIAPSTPSSGQAELTENQRIITDNIKNIDYYRHQHRIYEALLALRNEAERVREIAWKKANAPTIRM